MSSSPKGYPTQKKDDLVVGAQFATVEPVEGDKFALDVHASMYVRTVGSDAVEANSTATAINATAHAAKVGDIIRITSGALDEERARVIKTETNIIHVTALSAAPATAVTFDILRHVNPRANEDGDIQVNVTSTAAPTIFKLDGVDTEVSEDTGTPANSDPFPVKVLDGAGVEVDFATEATLASIETDIASIAAEDFATETTLAALEAKVTVVDTGDVTISAPLPAGTNNIGDVDVLTLPSLPAGTNNIGDVDVVSLPTLTVVDFIDTTPVLDTSVSNIPANATTPLTIVASLAADVKKVQLLDTTGEFIGLYADPAGTPVLLAVFGPGSDSTVELEISATTALGLRNMANTTISTGNVCINFMG